MTIDRELKKILNKKNQFIKLDRMCHLFYTKEENAKNKKLKNKVYVRVCSL